MKASLSKKIIVVLVSLLVLSSFSVLSAAVTTRGAITIAFDDGFQSQYDYAFSLLQARGMQATFYVNTARINTPSFMNTAELQTLQNYGNEIASHSNNHIEFPSISDSQMMQECQVSQNTLRSWGLTANNFAYPDAARNAHTDSIVAQYYRSARWGYVGPFVVPIPTSQFLLPAIDGSVTLSADTSFVDQISAANGWGIIVFHDVSPTAGIWQNHIGTADLQTFLNYVQAKGVAVLTVDQALNAVSTPTPSPTPTTTPTPTPSPTPTSTTPTLVSGGGSVVIGDTTIESNNDGVYANFVIGGRVLVPQDSSILSMSIYSGGSGANAKLAIYSDNNGAVGTLLSQSSSIVLVAGWNTASVSSTSLAGLSRVWLVWMCDRDLSAGMRYTLGSANQGFYVSRSYSSGFPSALSGVVYTADVWSIYAT